VSEMGVVVGASGGIGGACAWRLAELPAELVAVSRRSPEPRLLALPNVAWHQADLTLEVERASICARVTGAERALRYIVLAAGIPHRGAVGDASVKDWRRVLDANVVGPAMLINDLAREARWSEKADIVVIGSLSARRALPGRSLYGATKAGIEHFARAAAVELAPRGVCVNVASVGVTDTPFLDGDRGRIEDHARARVPIGRLGKPSEVADVVHAVVTGPALLTGATIDVDGGAGVLG
jgi:3-oxoacyl-[acyl-carrier protein] reductase